MIFFIRSIQSLIFERHFLIVVFLLLFCVGCATSTPDTRRAERPDAYARLGSEEKGLVDEGQVAVGMGVDAVFIAWGKPDQVLHKGTSEGTTETWLYHGSKLQSYHSWRFRETHDQNGRAFLVRALVTDYHPQSYVRAEIRFEAGKVKEWKTLSRPVEGSTLGE